jgi:hypothetical protein
MPGSIPRSRKVYLVALLVLTVIAGIAGYIHGKDDGPRLTYEQQCRAHCGTLPSQVKKIYLDPMSPESRRNMPRSIECLCGSATSGKRLL